MPELISIEDISRPIDVVDLALLLGSHKITRGVLL
jgi:hypothetical protein